MRKILHLVPLVALLGCLRPVSPVRGTLNPYHGQVTNGPVCEGPAIHVVVYEDGSTTCKCDPPLALTEKPGTPTFTYYCQAASFSW